MSFVEWLKEPRATDSVRAILVVNNPSGNHAMCHCEFDPKIIEELRDGDSTGIELILDGMTNALRKLLVT